MMRLSGLGIVCIQDPEDWFQGHLLITSDRNGNGNGEGEGGGRGMGMGMGRSGGVRPVAHQLLFKSEWPPP